jgi:DNA-binding NarL/FixJ family response regulator
VCEANGRKELKIVIADDSGLIRESLWRLLSATEEFKIVGMAANGVEAVELVRELQPHLLVLDNSMPLKDGFEALKEIRATDSATVIVMFTANQSAFFRAACLAAGADYFLDKAELARLIEICKKQLPAL